MALDMGVPVVTGGMPVGADGRVHTTLTRNAATLRLTSVLPNMQNIPRGGTYGKLVKQMFVCPDGWTFWKRDYSGIEAYLVGILANSYVYTRLATIDIHSYFTAFKLAELDHILPVADLPQTSWSDADLRAYLKGIKKKYPHDRQTLKHVGHSANYMGGAAKIQEIMLKELGKVYPVKEIQKMIDLYYAIFPDIPRWHSSTCLQVDAMVRQKTDTVGGGARTGVAYVTNPFGFPMRFHNVLQWEKHGEEWIWDYGKDAKALIAAIPQSTAAFIYCEATMQLEHDYPDVAETLRLLIHDELLGECREEHAERCLVKSKEVMERPIPQIPLNPEWGMGPLALVRTEAKVGPCWAEMQDAD